MLRALACSFLNGLRKGKNKTIFFTHTSCMSKGKSKKLKQLEEDAVIMSAWRVFNQTGNVAHYLLYKRLTEKD